MPAFGKPYKETRSPEERRARSGFYTRPDLQKRVERRKLNRETFRLSEERRKGQEAKKPKPPKPKPPKPPKTGMQRFTESLRRAIGLGGLTEALEPKKSKKK